MSTAILEQMAAVTGARNIITDADAMVPYLKEWRDLFRGKAQAVVRPGSTAEVAALVKLAARDRHRAGAAGRQYRACRRADPDRGRPRDHPVAAAARCDPHGRSRRRHDDRRGRGDPAARAGGSREGRAAVPALARLGRLLHRRRQSLDQCRRHRRAGLWQCPRAVHGARSGAGRWPDLERAAAAAQGQYRLRPQEPLHRRGRHARHHHRRRPEALPAAGRAGHRLPGGARAGGSAGAAQCCQGRRRWRAHNLRADVSNSAWSSCCATHRAPAIRSPNARPGTC